MICLDTTVLIDQFRSRGSPEAPVQAALRALAGEAVGVPVIVAGEYLEGAALVSDARLAEARRYLATLRLLPVEGETALIYARLAAALRARQALGGRSQNDLWIAATALRHGARLLTRNPADFAGIPSLEVVGYGQRV